MPTIEELLMTGERTSPALGAFGKLLEAVPAGAGYFGGGEYIQGQQDRIKLRELLEQQRLKQAQFESGRTALGPGATPEDYARHAFGYLDPATTVKSADEYMKLLELRKPKPVEERNVAPGHTVLGKDRKPIFQAPFSPKDPTERPQQMRTIYRGELAVQQERGVDGVWKDVGSGRRFSPTEGNAAYTAGLREVAKDDKDIANVSQMENALKRWQELQQTVPTGRVAGERPAIAQPLYQQMIQLESFLAVNNFKPGQGQISNFERQLIKGAGPTVRNDPEANMDITNVMLGGVQNARDRASFREWFLEKNRKLLGADKQWNEYIEKNPRFSKSADGRIVENTKRQDWMTYFSARATTDGGFSDAEKERRYQEWKRRQGG